MINSITLHNFQVHEELTIQLDPHVTTIVGPTDAGKSAVLRALRWAALNTPTGESFVRHGSKCAKVVLRAGKHKVVRVRGSGVNTYRLDHKVYEAFKGGVPDDVANLLKLTPINFQRQHDGPYWFGETAGMVSRQLNQIVDLGIIDTTLANLASSLRKAYIEVSVVEERLEQAQAKRVQCKEALVLDTKLKVVEAKWAAVEELVSRRERLAILTQEVRRLQTLSKRVVPNLDSLTTAWRAWVGVKERHDSLQSLMLDIEGEVNTEWSLKEELKDAQQRYTKAIGKTCPLCGQKIPS